MSRVHFTFLLIAIALPNISLRAEEPAKKVEQNKGGVTSGSANVTVTFAGVAAGGTNATQGTLFFAPAPGGGPMNQADWRSRTTDGGTLILGPSSNLVPSPGPNFVPAPGSFGGSIATAGINNTMTIAALDTSAACQPGKAFYIITEGAGIGDNVRCFPCTGNETVLDAISKINGLSQVSSTKMWIARPSPASHDKSTILDIDWEAISRRGINATNYTLMPGDRLVLGEDPVIKCTNLIGKKTAMIERLNGVLGLTTATLRGLSDASPADFAVLTDLVRKGAFTDDEEIKGMLLETLHRCELEREKAGSKEAEKSKAGQ